MDLSGEDLMKKYFVIILLFLLGVACSSSEESNNTTEADTLTLELAAQYLQAGTRTYVDSNGETKSICNNYIYHLDGFNSILYLVEVSSGKTLEIAEYPSVNFANNLAIHIDGTLYSITEDSSGAELMRLGLDGSTETLGPTGIAGDVIAMDTTVNGSFFAIDEDYNRAYLVDSRDGSSHLLESSDDFDFRAGDVVLDKHGGIIYIDRYGVIYDLAISVEDHTVSVIQNRGTLPTDEDQYYTSAAYIDEVLYVFDRTNDRLYQVDINTLDYTYTVLDIDVQYGDAAACELHQDVETLVSDALNM